MHSAGYTLGALLLVLGGLVLVLRVLGKYSHFRTPKGRDMEILQQVALGAKERIVCLRIQGVKLLVGITPHTISTLHVFEDLNDVPPTEQIP